MPTAWAKNRKLLKVNTIAVYMVIDIPKLKNYSNGKILVTFLFAVCFGAENSGFPQPDSSNKLCATNGQQGGIGPSNPDTCKDATSDGIISSSTCDENCIQNRCKNEPLCKGYGKDNQGNVRLVSSITSIGPSNAWKTVRKTTCKGKRSYSARLLNITFKFS